MKTSTVSFMMLLAPAAIFAQTSGQASASASASVNASATADFHAPKEFSAQGSAKLEAMYAEAKEHHVPREPMARRVAEGRAKGASETAIIASAGKVKANLEATNEAMVAGGRAHPSDDECTRGASAMERGVTKAQIQAMAQSSPGDRSLVVAFETLTKLTLKGVPVTQAVAQVQSNISSGGSDAALVTLGSTTSVVGSAANTTNGANAAANATGNATATTKPLGGTITTAVGAVIKKP